MQTDQKKTTAQDNRYCRDLDVGFNIDPAVLNWLQHQPTDRTVRAQYDLRHFIDHQIHKLCYDRGVYVTHADAFFTPAHGSLGIHVDGICLQDHCKLNWVFGADGSVMRWWRPLIDNVEPKTTIIGTKYLGFQPNDCELIHEACIGQPSLVNVGQPHSISNPTDHGRWCLSFLLKSMATREFVQWDDAINIFGDCLTTNC